MADLCAVVLAGGEGKRMKSERPKVLSKVLFEPMLKWVLDALREAGINDICVVTGSKSEFVKEYLATLDFPVETVFQAERLGTGHAVMMAGRFIVSHRTGDVLILNGDAPFVGAETIKSAVEAHISSGENRGCTVISAEVDDPKGYGRIVREGQNGLKAIVEEKEADDETRKICEVNSGAYCFRSDVLLQALGQLEKSELTGEYYLTDTVQIIRNDGKIVNAYKAENSDSVLGANDCVQLAQLNEIARMRVLTNLMKEGVNIPCTDGVMIGRNVKIGADTLILPSTVIRGNAEIGSFCEIGPGVLIDGGKIADKTRVFNRSEQEL